jgi:hypothetical protein
MLNRIKNWLREKISNFLGLSILETRITATANQLGEMITMAIDIPGHRKSPATIIIAARLKNGYVRILDMHISSITELEALAKELQARYNIRDENIFADYPPGYPRRFFNRRNHHAPTNNRSSTLDKTYLQTRFMV